MIGGLYLGQGYLGGDSGSSGPIPPTPTLVPRRVLKTRGGIPRIESKG